MLVKTIKYTDYNDIEREEEFHFNLTKAELMEMNLMTEGGLSQKIEKITKAMDIPVIAAEFKKIILVSFGVPSDDGKRFIKSPELTKAFTETPAYSELYMQLSRDADAAAEFINGIVPKNIN